MEDSRVIFYNHLKSSQTTEANVLFNKLKYMRNNMM